MLKWILTIVIFTLIAFVINLIQLLLFLRRVNAFFILYSNFQYVVEGIIPIENTMEISISQKYCISFSSIEEGYQKFDQQLSKLWDCYDNLENISKKFICKYYYYLLDGLIDVGVEIRKMSRT